LTTALNNWDDDTTDLSSELSKAWNEAVSQDQSLLTDKAVTIAQLAVAIQEILGEGGERYDNVWTFEDSLNLARDIVYGQVR
jgi:hypothetical protein